LIYLAIRLLERFAGFPAAFNECRNDEVQNVNHGEDGEYHLLCKLHPIDWNPAVESNHYHPIASVWLRPAISRS
jgi:hypothetical protein